MFYREAGQFRTTYAQDFQLLPLRQDRIGMAVLLAVAFIGIPLVADDYLAERHPHSMADPVARRTRPKHPDGLCRPAFPGLGGLHGPRRVRLLQSDTAHRWHTLLCGRCTLRRVRRSGRNILRPPKSAHPRSLSGGHDTRGAVLHRLGPRQVRLVQELRSCGRHHSTADRHIGTCLHLARREIPGGPGHRRDVDACRKEHGARQHRTRLDGGPRHGRCRRSDGPVAAAHQIAGLCDQLLLLRRGRRAVRICLSSNGGAVGLHHRSIVPVSCSW